MACNFRSLVKFTSIVPQFKLRGSISYKNKKPDEYIGKFNLTNNIIARFQKDKDKDTSRLFFVDKNEKNIILSDLIVVEKDTIINGTHFPTELDPFSYSINWNREYKVYLNKILVMRIMNQKQQAVSM